MFGVPIRTEDYFIEELADPKNSYILETMDQVFGMEGYRVIGDREKGSSFHIYAEDGKALTIKSIEYITNGYTIVLQKVEKGTAMSHEKLSIISKQPFKAEQIQYDDGTKLRNIDIFADEVGLLKHKGIYQEVKGNEALIIPDGSSSAVAYTMYGVTAEDFKDFKKGDEVEFMDGEAEDIVYSVRLLQK